MKAEEDVDVCLVEIDALRQFVPYARVQFSRALIEMVQETDRDPVIRNYALCALRDCGLDALSLVLPQLAELLSDKDPTIRCGACTVLGMLGEDASKLWLCTPVRKCSADRLESAALGVERFYSNWAGS